MLKDAITILANYNKSVNENMNGVIETLNEDEWDKPLGIYFPSVRSICSHIYICDFNWLLRFGNIRSFRILSDPFFKNSFSFGDVLFNDMGEYLEKRPDLDNKIISFTEELTGADLEVVLKYHDSEGIPFAKNSGGCILHFLNHQVHHRGMISAYLEMLGRENDFCSLVEYIS